MRGSERRLQSGANFSGASWERGNISRGNHLRDIRDRLWFPRGVAHCGKGLISVFQEFLSSIDRFFILAAGLGTSLSFLGA